MVLYPINKTHCFFAHVAFATDARAHTIPQATANLLIEVSDVALKSGSHKKRPKGSAGKKVKEIELAGEVARTAACDYLKSAREFRKFPVQRFVDFRLTANPTYISIRPPPTTVLPNDSKVWRLAQSESDKLRAEPLPKTTKLK